MNPLLLFFLIIMLLALIGDVRRARRRDLRSRAFGEAQSPLEAAAAREGWALRR